MNDVSLSIATWNVRGIAKQPMLDFIERISPDVLFLQEVKEEKWPAYLELAGYSGESGLSLRGEPAEGGKRALGAAILVKKPLTLIDAKCLRHPGFAWPERLVSGLVQLPAGPLVRLVAYHALHGGHGRIKPESSQALGLWLSEQEGPVLCGMDANSPFTDHPDEALIECMWAQTSTRELERALLATERKHKLSDVWRTYLSQHPEVLAEIRKASPEGPLAVTHRTGPGRTNRRFDHLWATKDFHVECVKHLHEGFDVGSDHAMVLATVSVR